MYYKRRSEIIEAFFYINYDSIPENLKYSNNNPQGLMPLNLDVGCSKCKKKALNHLVYFRNGKENIICPNRFIIYKDNLVIEDLDKEDFNKIYYKIEIKEGEYSEVEKGFS